MKPADRCPGVLAPHLAEDGAMVRLRLPGGQTTAATLRALSDLAGTYGNPELQLTARAGLQLRGLPTPVPSGLTETVRALGLLPSASHERVRNVVASPLTGFGGRIDVRGLVDALDQAIQAVPRLAGLPGRFLFAVDDGSGDVSGRAYDLGYHAVTPEDGWLLVGDARHGRRVTAAAAPAALVTLAEAFLAVRDGEWSVRDRPAWIDSLGLTDPGLTGQATSRRGPIDARIPVGAVAGAASVRVPLGLLTPDQVATIGRVASRVVLTPDRGLVLPSAAAALPELLAAGLVADATSPWTLLSACVGAPGCGRAHGSTRVRASAVAAAGVWVRTHVSGCGRRCGAPSGPHTDLVLG